MIASDRFSHKKKGQFKGFPQADPGTSPRQQLLRLGTVPSVKKDSALEVQAARDSPSLAPWPLDATQKSVPGV